MTASGVLTSCATPAASRPTEESFSACASCDSSCMRPVMSSTRMMRPTTDQRRDGNVGGPRLTCMQRQLELIEVVNAGLVFEPPEFAHKLCREDGIDPL